MRVAYRCDARLQNATFKQCFDQGLILVRSPEDTELRAMIEQPAHAIGLNIEREVVDELIADVRGEPSATYLLQDTLVRLWKLRKYNWITMDAYRELGGVNMYSSRAPGKSMRRYAQRSKEMPEHYCCTWYEWELTGKR